MTTKPIDVLSVETVPPVLFIPSTTLTFGPIGPSSAVFAPLLLAADVFLDFCLIGPGSQVFPPTLNPDVTLIFDVIGPSSIVENPHLGVDETMNFELIGPGSQVENPNFGDEMSFSLIGPTSATFSPTLLSGSLLIPLIGSASIVPDPLLGVPVTMPFALIGSSSGVFPPLVDQISTGTAPPKLIEKVGGQIITITAPVGLLPEGFYTVIVNGITTFAAAGAGTKIRTKLLVSSAMTALDKTEIKFTAPPLPPGVYNIDIVGTEDGVTRPLPGALLVIPYHFSSGATALRKKLSKTWQVGYIEPSDEEPQ